VYSDAGYDVSFGDDSSGALAVLGINTFFQGTTGLDIALRDEVAANTELVSVGYGPGENTTALAIAQLREAKLTSLSGRTLMEQWGAAVESTSVRASAATTRHEALSTVRASLEAQQAAISGVSLDEESINLITFQQQYAGAARFISVVDELTQLLINLVEVVEKEADMWGDA
jgi:flagellar hook-associated protein 1 FlgK